MKSPILTFTLLPLGATVFLAANVSAKPDGRPLPAMAPATTAKLTSPPQIGGDLARAAFIPLMDSDFKQRDFDNDGKVTRAEIEKFEKQRNLIQAQKDNRVLFLQLDTDRNGVVTPSEFTALIPPPGFPDVSKIMQRFDSNRDQIISLIEYRVATLSNFDKLDVDKDGVLSILEQQPISADPSTSEKVR